MLFDLIRSKHYEERKMFEGDATVVEREDVSTTAATVDVEDDEDGEDEE